MPNYECLPCSFSTKDKTKFSVHLTSKKHLNKCNSNTCCNDEDSVKSAVTDSSVTSSVLLEEMRNLMKQQNIQRENDRLAFEEQKNLMKQQLEQQQLQIDFLKNMLNQQANTQINTQASINTNVNKIVEQTTPFCKHTFLNETCKNAIELDDFIMSIKVSYDDYMNVFDYVKQVSNKITEEVTRLGEKRRPIHCFDSRRKVFYIKHNNEWNKCDENDELIKRLIFTIQKKYSDYICVYLEKNPNYLKSNKMCEEHMARVLQIVDEDNKDKILRSIMNAICIAK